MKKNISIICLLLIVVAISFYLIGYTVASDRVESKISSQTFYATITNIKDTFFTVKGMDVNDINFRGDFTFNVSEETTLVWRGTKIELSDFHVNDNISVTWMGEIQETSPAHIVEVIQVQLLDTEK